jgi:hypothetical protein
MSDKSSDLDRPLYGAEAIGREAEIFDDDGNVDLNRTYYALEKKYLDADKFGRLWISTPRRVRKAFIGASVTT